jgi:hypothetical protein
MGIDEISTMENLIFNLFRIIGSSIAAVMLILWLYLYLKDNLEINSGKIWEQKTDEND